VANNRIESVFQLLDGFVMLAGDVSI
jgi:hypothetical protein